MKVLILGIDGYIGFPLAVHLLKRGHRVYGIDNQSRRFWVNYVGGNSVTPIDPIEKRTSFLKKCGDFPMPIVNRTLGLEPQGRILMVLKDFQPDAIIHLAEQPSASFSMRSPEDSIRTQMENTIGTLQLLWAMKTTCPDAHLVKLGSMGEYGTPECRIPEGKIEKECTVGADGAWRDVECPMSGLMFPRQPGSFYHLSKVHDSYNIDFCCRTWNFRSTDIMQGIVFGLNEDSFLTRFDCDQYFGTVINRFCAQALIGMPLTLYGSGQQKRSFLHLKDSLQCLTLILENPPRTGEYRTFNQFHCIYTLSTIAQMVLNSAHELNLPTSAERIANPRAEAESHIYGPSNDGLKKLGYVPTADTQGELTKLLNQLTPFTNKINKKAIFPTTTWR